MAIPVTFPDNNTTMKVGFGQLTPGVPGPKGDPGIPGPPGKTPVKGVDYYTEADKQEMVSAVIEALPKYNGEVISE